LVQLADHPIPLPDLDTRMVAYHRGGLSERVIIVCALNICSRPNVVVSIKEIEPV
jgi:hypothetical protein